MRVGASKVVHAFISVNFLIDTSTYTHTHTNQTSSHKIIDKNPNNI